jgi:hypothetical protein
MGRNEAALVYAGLTLLLVFYMVILPSLFPYLFGGAELFGLYVITVVFVIFAIHIKHSFSGNISKYDISEFRLLWKDDMETAAHSSVIAWALKRLRGLGFIIVVIISSIIGGLAVYLRYYGLISQIDYMLVFLLIMSFIIILVLLIYLFAMFLSHRLLKRGGKRGLHVYREG